MVLIFLKKYWKQILFILGIIAGIVLVFIGKHYIAGIITGITGIVAAWRINKERQGTIDDIDDRLNDLDNAIADSKKGLDNETESNNNLDYDGIGDKLRDL